MQCNLAWILAVCLSVLPGTHECADHISGQWLLYYNYNISIGMNNATATCVIIGMWHCK